MSSASQRTFELLTQLANSKKNLSDTLVAKGEEAEFSEPFDDLVQKAADYIPKSYIFVDEEGDEVAGSLVSQETVFDAVENDVREGKVFASELGVKTGTKVIPSYNTHEGVKIVTAGSKFEITTLTDMELFKFTKLQAIICDFNTSLSDSVSASKVSISGNVYEVKTVLPLAVVTANETTQSIDFGITNETNKPQILRYFTYKEIY